MSERTYWLGLFSGTTWQEFVNAGSEVIGFREGRWTTVQRIKPGDYILGYLTGVSRWVTILEVVAAPFRDPTPRWKDDVFPCRLRVTIVAALTPETAVPVFELRDQLSVFRNLKNPSAWTGSFRGSPRKWKASDGETVVKAVLGAQQHPVHRPVDPKKLARRPPVLNAEIGPVTIPETVEAPTEGPSALDPTPHTAIQWLLAKLGNDMGLGVWIARNDRGREVDGHRFTDLPRLNSALPRQFDEATNRTVELIDVLWLDGNAIVAAFEIESTTAIYSGLLRMSDLIAMQPNLSIPLYIVAPDERREKVISEVNRPTFSHLSPRMADICRFISFATLQERLERIGAIARYLRPDFLEEASESCEVEDT
ncbi:MAG: hypothetical protein CMJ84_00105 [Planctomycetes bacterium]|nr:hypothetical protein [Planctomycetota bacterium]